MIELLFGLVVFALFACLVWWLLSTIGPGLPQPVRMIIMVLFVLICIIVLLNYLPLGGLPHGRYVN
jgi:hypothetical protein